MFVGRKAEQRRIVRALARVPVAIVYGVAGMGKTALCLACAAGWQERAATTPEGAGPLFSRVLRGEVLAALCDDLRRDLAGGGVSELESDAERLADLCRRLEASRAVLVLDDLHLLPGDDQRALVTALSSGLKDARALASSRERVARAASDPDRVELQLEALGEEEARELWASLDELYGAVAGFEQAMARARGNPLLLRRAHAGGLEDSHPIEDAVRALAGDERRVTGALALCSLSLPLPALAALFPGDSEGRLREAVRGLAQRLVVEVDGAGSACIHDLFREAIEPLLGEDERAEIHRALARAVESAPVDPPQRAREITRHLVAARRFDEAGAHLVAEGAELVRLGATGELLRALESIPEAQRSPEVRLTRARCLVRSHDFARALVELERLEHSGAEPRAEIRYTYATAVYSSGQLELALGMLAELAADTSLDPSMRVQVVTQHAWGLTSSGRVDEAVEELRNEERAAPDTETAALLAFYRAGALWAAERNDEMAAALERAKALTPDATLPYGSSSATRLLLAAMLARLGRHDEANQLLAAGEGERHEDIASQVNEQRLTGLIRYELGERLAGLELLRAAAAAYRRAGNAVSALVCEAWVGRILLVVGRRSEGLRILADTEARARDIGANGPAESCARGRALDPLAGPESALLDPVRRLALACVSEAAAGRGAASARLSTEVRARAQGPGYGLDRALAEIGDALSARRDDNPDPTPHTAIDRARHLAIEDGVDEDLVPALVEKVASDAVRQADAAAVIDGRSHELRLGDKVISFKRRAALRRMLYALARRQGATVTKAELAETLWAARYNPLRHDNAIWVNIRRLRQLLEGTSLSIDLSEEGYRLDAAEGLVFVPPS